MQGAIDALHRMADGASVDAVELCDFFLRLLFKKDHAHHILLTGREPTDRRAETVCALRPFFTLRKIRLRVKKVRKVSQILRERIQRQHVSRCILPRQIAVTALAFFPATHEMPPLFAENDASEVPAPRALFRPERTDESAIDFFRDRYPLAFDCDVIPLVLLFHE